MSNVQKKVENNENENVEPQATTEPVAQAQVVVVPQQQPVKEGFFARIGNAIKRNKKAIIAGVSGLGAGVAGTVAYGYFSNKRDEKRRQERELQYIQSQPVDVNPLDPNV